MFRKDVKHRYEQVDQTLHPEHERRDTRVSEYLRKYGQGKIDSMPTDSRPEVNDKRSVDEMLADIDKLTSALGTEQLDAMLAMQDKAADFEAAMADISLTKRAKEKFDAAIKVLNDSNATYEQKSDAYRILDELEKQNKISRVRD